MTYSAMRKEERGNLFSIEELSRPVDRRALRRGRDLLTRGRVGRRGRAISVPFSQLAPARTSVMRWGGSTVTRFGLTGRGWVRRSMADPYPGWPRRSLAEADQGVSANCALFTSLLKGRLLGT